MARSNRWDHAILAVLQEAEQPLEYSEIARRATRKVLGATPASTVTATLSAMVEAGTVVRTEREVFRLNGEYHLGGETTVANDRSSAATTKRSQPTKHGVLPRLSRRKKGEMHVATAIGLLMFVGAVFLACAGFMGWIMVDCPPFKAQFPPAGISCNLFFSLTSIGMPIALASIIVAAVVDIITMPAD